ncbi:MAG: hypothetical protein AB7T32_08770, partial [Dehalococcoidia bacterium]
MQKRHSTLWSLLAIGAVIAIVSGVVSMAAFQDSATGKIAVKSGTLELSVTGEEEDTYILLPIDTDNCPTATAM